MPRSFEHMLQYVSEQIEVPAQPRSLGACLRAIANAWRTEEPWPRYQ